MLIFSRAKITLYTPANGDKEIRVEGDWHEHHARIVQYFRDCPVASGTISHRWGRIRFSRAFAEKQRQRARNFLINRCALR